MLIHGKWEASDDGIERPIVTARLLAANGAWIAAPFLVDTGADRSVISASILGLLGAGQRQASHAIQGVGGDVSSVIISTTVGLDTASGQELEFRGEFAAVTVASDLDICVLGRDVTDFFAVIVDRPGDSVCLLGPPASYRLSDAPAN